MTSVCVREYTSIQRLIDIDMRLARLNEEMSQTLTNSADLNQKLEESNLSSYPFMIPNHYNQAGNSSQEASGLTYYCPDQNDSGASNTYAADRQQNYYVERNEQNLKQQCLMIEQTRELILMKQQIDRLTQEIQSLLEQRRALVEISNGEFELFESVNNLSTDSKRSVHANPVFIHAFRSNDLRFVEGKEERICPSSNVSQFNKHLPSRSTTPNRSKVTAAYHSKHMLSPSKLQIKDSVIKQDQQSAITPTKVTTPKNYYTPLMDKSSNQQNSSKRIQISSSNSGSKIADNHAKIKQSSHSIAIVSKLQSSQIHNKYSSLNGSSQQLQKQQYVKQKEQQQNGGASAQKSQSISSSGQQNVSANSQKMQSSGVKQISSLKSSKGRISDSQQQEQKSILSENPKQESEKLISSGECQQFHQDILMSFPQEDSGAVLENSLKVNHSRGINDANNYAFNHSNEQIFTSGKTVNGEFMTESKQILGRTASTAHASAFTSEKRNNERILFTSEDNPNHLNNYYSAVNHDEVPGIQSESQIENNGMSLENSQGNEALPHSTVIQLISKLQETMAKKRMLLSPEQQAFEHMRTGIRFDCAIQMKLEQLKNMLSNSLTNTQNESGELNQQGEIQLANSQEGNIIYTTPFIAATITTTATAE